jgi:hypothetical protein
MLQLLHGVLQVPSTIVLANLITQGRVFQKAYWGKKE